MGLIPGPDLRVLFLTGLHKLLSSELLRCYFIKGKQRDNKTEELKVNHRWISNVTPFSGRRWGRGWGWLRSLPWRPDETLTSIVDLSHYLNFILFFFGDTTNWLKYYGAVLLLVWSFILYNQVSEPVPTSVFQVDQSTEQSSYCFPGGWPDWRAPGHMEGERDGQRHGRPGARSTGWGVRQDHRPFEVQSHKWGGCAGPGSGGRCWRREVLLVCLSWGPQLWTRNNTELPKPRRCIRNETQNDFKFPMLSQHWNLFLNVVLFPPLPHLN